MFHMLHAFVDWWDQSQNERQYLRSSAAVKRDDGNLVRFASWDQTSRLSQTVIQGSVEHSGLHTTLSRQAEL